MKILKSISALLIVLASQLQAGAQAATSKKPDKVAFLRGNFTSAIGDSVTISIWDDLFAINRKYFITHREYKAPVIDGKFAFRIDSLPDKAYFTLGGIYKGVGSRGDVDPLLENFIISAGDSITIREIPKEGHKLIVSESRRTLCYDCRDYSFSGKGAAKYSCRWDLTESSRLVWEQADKMFKPREENSLIDRIRRDSILNGTVIKEGLKTLAKFKGKLSQDTYELFRTDIYASSAYNFYASLNITVQTTVFDEYKAADIARSQEYYLRACRAFNVPGNDPEVINFSAYYPVVKIYKSTLESKLFRKAGTFALLQKQVQPVTRERVITAYLYTFPKDIDSGRLMAAALREIRNPKYNAIVSSIYKKIKIGSPVYNFSLQDSTGRIVELSDLRGRIVFVDFFFVGCGGCSYYYQNTLAAVEEHFKDSKDVVFVTVSIDMDKDLWLKGLRSGKYTSSVAINLNTGTSGGSHPVIKELLINDYPCPLIIDREGRLLVNDNDRLRDSDVNALIRTIQEAISKV